MPIHGSAKGWANLRAKQTTPKYDMSCYRDREESLLCIGYRSYKEYLDGEEWQTIRNQILSKYPLCIVCRQPATEVHHMSYALDVLLGVCKWELVSICHSCHESIEYKEGKKRTLDEANQSLYDLVKRSNNRRISRGWIKMLGIRRARWESKCQQKEAHKRSWRNKKKKPKYEKTERRPLPDINDPASVIRPEVLLLMEAERQGSRLKPRVPVPEQTKKKKRR